MRILSQRETTEKSNAASGFGLRGLASAFFQIQKERFREYFVSKRARHGRKLRIVRMAF
jgi:hypothetical protein